MFAIYVPAFHFLFSKIKKHHSGLVSAAFVLRHPLVASTIFGATKTWQLQEAINACHVELKSEVIEEINKVHAKFPNPCP